MSGETIDSPRLAQPAIALEATHRRRAPIERLAPALVGRRSEVEMLVAAWKSARRGAGRTVVIEGEDGIGKSRLLRELVEHVSSRVRRNATVLLATPLDADRSEPLATARRLLAPLCDAVGIAGASERALAELSTIVPALRGRFLQLPPVSGDALALGPSLIEAIDAVADEAPVLLVVDDFERCDAETRRLLLELVERLPRSTLVVLAAAPGEWADAARCAGFPEPPEVQRIELHPLVETETEVLIGSMIELESEPRRRLAERIHRESGGVPFCVIELVAALGDPGALALDADGPSAAPNALPAGSPEVAYHRARAAARSRRRRSLYWPVGAAAGAVLLLAAMAVTRATRADGEPASYRRVVIAEFENQTRDAQLDGLGRIIAGWLTDGVARTGLVGVSQPIRHVRDETGGAPPDSQRLRSMARSARADVLVSGAYSVAGDSLRFEARLVDTRTGEQLGAVAPVVSLRTAPLGGVERLRQKTLAALAPWIDERLTAAARVQSTPPSYESYLAFAQGLDRFYARDPGAVPYFARAYALDTSFTLPLLFEALTRNGLTQYAAADSLLHILRPRRFRLAPYDRYIFDMIAASLRGDAAATYEAARAAAEAAPGSYAGVLLPGIVLGANRPTEALAMLLPADTVHGEAGRLASYWAMAANAQHMLGDYEGELRSGRFVRHRFPQDPRYLHYEARALAALGRLDELDALLVESLRWRAIPGWGPPGLRVHITASNELRTHGHDSAARAVLERGVTHYEVVRGERPWSRLHADLARALYELGRADEARRIADGLTRDKGGAVMSDLEVVALLACVAAAQRDTVTLRAIDQRLRAWPDPYVRGGNTEIRARVEALLGRRDEALQLLQQAVDEGLPFAIGYHSQFEFAGLRGYAPFEAWLRPKG